LPAETESESGLYSLKAKTIPRKRKATRRKRREFLRK